MESNGDGKPEPIDPEATARILELELMRQRAALKQAGTPYRGLRAASFIFLIVIILGGLMALYYLFTSGRLEELRAHTGPQSPGAATSPAP